MNGDIFFVGDSFCSCFHLPPDRRDRTPDHQLAVRETENLHPSLVAAHFDYRLHLHGYGGKSWWYSRYKFFADLKKSQRQSNFDPKAVVFFHSDAWRINNYWNESLGQTRADNDPNKDFYYKHILDPVFQEWAQEQWYWEISREFAEIKTVHFFCFPTSLANTQCLPGVVFDNISLIEISVAEITGSREEIHKAMSVDEKRFNHLNDYNNRALAGVIVDALENYEPGHRELDLSRFDMPNPNYKNWPKGNFGTT